MRSHPHHDGSLKIRVVDGNTDKIPQPTTLIDLAAGLLGHLSRAAAQRQQAPIFSQSCEVTHSDNSLTDGRRSLQYTPTQVRRHSISKNTKKGDADFTETYFCVILRWENRDWLIDCTLQKLCTVITENMAENAKSFPKVEYVLFDMDGAPAPSLSPSRSHFSPYLQGL